ncbi:MAG: oligosaccharide flippase family protein [Acidimicrobiia bacterium]|nr:oligosaccharide flippase family protein [Acidimicrobiia bacterium]
MPGARRLSGTRTSFRGALKWSAVMNVGSQLATLVVTFVLAKFLGPELFGVVAMATVYVAFLQMLLQQGMTAALIQRRELEPLHVDTAFWLILAATSGLSVVSVVLAGAWSNMNDTPVLADVIVALTPILIIRGLIIVPDALLRRQMNFKPLAARMNVSVLVGGAIGVSAAFAGWGVWALVAQQLSAAIVELVLVWVAVAYRPSLRFSREAARALVGYSAPSLTASLGVFISGRADAFIVGAFFGPTTVGLYRFAARLVDVATQSIVGSFRAVALPELARHQDDPARLGSRMVAIVRLNAALTILPLAALAAAAPAIIEVLGPEWSPAVTALAILTVAGAARTLGSMSGPLLQAIGRPGSLAALAWFGAVGVTVTLVAAGLLMRSMPEGRQVNALAVATALLHAGPFLAANTWVIARHTGVRARQLLCVLAPSAVAGIHAFAAGAVIDRATADLPALVRVACVGGSSVLVGGAALIILDASLRDQVARLLAASRRGPAASIPLLRMAGRPKI